jgi:hypothetical protein
VGEVGEVGHARPHRPQVGLPVQALDEQTPLQSTNPTTESIPPLGQLLLLLLLLLVSTSLPPLVQVGDDDSKFSTPPPSAH